MSLRDNYIFDLDENVTRIPVSYKNRFGITIAADLYRPKDFDKSREHAAVIVGAPYGGVKEQGPGIYAQNMALRGSVALTFDPSFNGYSGGEPRHLSSPDIFVEDFSAAVDYLGTRPYVDRERIGVIGMCGSGALSLSATQVDRRIKAVAPVVMYDHHRLYAEGFENSLTDEQRIAFIDERLEQRYADFESDVPLLTPRDAPIGFDENTDPIAREFGEFYSTQRGYHPNSITQFTTTFCHISSLIRVVTCPWRPQAANASAIAWLRGWSSIRVAALIFSSTTPGVRKMAPKCVMARSTTHRSATTDLTTFSLYNPFCTQSTVVSPFVRCLTPAIASLVSDTFVVSTMRALVQSAVRPRASVSRPSPSICNSRSKTSGWAFSTSSNRTTANGWRRRALVSRPSGWSNVPTRRAAEPGSPYSLRSKRSSRPASPKR